MNASEQFQMAEGYARYRPVAEVTIPKAIEMLSKMVVFARAQKIEKLLLDTTGLTGFEPPEIFQRYKLAEQLARDAESTVKVVIVARPEMIHPEKIGVTIARNRGLWANVFSSEAEALAWLLDPKAE